MKSKMDIDKKVDEALLSIDAIERASAPPFFFTRLEARMQKGNTLWEKISVFLTNPVFAFGSICLILFFNIYVISSSPATTMNIAQQTSELATVDEYSQVSSNLFEFENLKP